MAIRSESLHGASLRAAEATSEPLGLDFLATRAFSATQRRFALGVLAVVSLFFLVAAPFARLQLPVVWAFLPFYQTALIVNAAITALLLLGQVPMLRSWALLVLACGYLFNAALALSHALSFPGLFSPAGLFGDGFQLTAWLYFLWHMGFALWVAAYGLLRGRGHIVVIPSHRLNATMAGAVALTLLIAGALVLLTVTHPRLLPPLMHGNHDDGQKIWAALATWLCGLLALAILWFRRPRSVLDVWLLVVMCAWMFDTGLAAVLNHARFDLGWYAGRLCGLLAESLVLAMLLVENSLLHSRLMLIHERERRQSQLRLYASEARFEATFEQAPVGIALLSLDGRWLRANRTLCDLLGYTHTELPEHTFGEVVEDVSLIPGDPATAVLASDQPPTGPSETRCRHKDGRWLWTQCTAMLTRHLDGRPAYFILMIQDIQARKDTEAALRRSEQRFRAIFDHATVAMYIVDPHDGTIQDANRQALAVQGCRSTEALRGRQLGIGWARGKNLVLTRIKAAGAGEAQHFEARHMRRRGQSAWEDVLMTRVRINDAEQVLVIATDISARKRLEQEVIGAGTAERERIGRDLHDGISQQLTGVNMLMGAVGRRLQGAGAAREAASVAEVNRHVEGVLKEVRTLAAGLVPMQIEPDGLGKAFAALAASVSASSGIRCRYHGARDATVGDAATANHLFRLAQEAVQNAVRHAHARRIDIVWQRDTAHVHLEIRDDGTGMSAQQQRPVGGMGLHTMAYRADLIGGHLSIEPGEEGGTCVRCVVPV